MSRSVASGTSRFVVLGGVEASQAKAVPSATIVTARWPSGVNRKLKT
jgi:hypothetical protein